MKHAPQVLQQRVMDVSGRGWPRAEFLAYRAIDAFRLESALGHGYLTAPHPAR